MITAGGKVTDGYCTCYGSGSDRMRDCGIRQHRIEANEVRGLGSHDPLEALVRDVV